MQKLPGFSYLLHWWQMFYKNESTLPLLLHCSLAFSYLASLTLSTGTKSMTAHGDLEIYLFAAYP